MSFSPFAVSTKPICTPLYSRPILRTTLPLPEDFDGLNDALTNLAGSTESWSASTASPGNRRAFRLSYTAAVGSDSVVLTVERSISQ